MNPEYHKQLTTAMNFIDKQMTIETTIILRYGNVYKHKIFNHERYNIVHTLHREIIDIQSDPMFIQKYNLRREVILNMYYNPIIIKTKILMGWKLPFDVAYIIIEYMDSEGIDEYSYFRYVDNLIRGTSNLTFRDSLEYAVLRTTKASI